MKYLITGGAGFIGSHLTEFHLKKQDKVWVIDNLSTGKIENLAHVLDHPYFRFTKEDITTYPLLDEAIAWADGIYHLAAIVGQKVVLAKPFGVLFDNVRGCERILRSLAANKSTSKRLVITSTSEVYGPDGNSTFKENASLAFPSGEFLQVNYSLSKFVDECLALSAIHEWSLNCVIARLFNTTGPNQTGRYGMVVPRFVQQALKQEPLTIYGNGLQTRSFCDIRDCLSMLELCMTHPKAQGEIFNIGNDREITILELAQLVKERAQSTSNMVFVPYKEAYGIDFKDTVRRCPDLSKIRAFFNYQAKWSLEDTLDSLIERYSMASI